VLLVVAVGVLFFWYARNREGRDPRDPLPARFWIETAPPTRQWEQWGAPQLCQWARSLKAAESTRADEECSEEKEDAFGLGIDASGSGEHVLVYVSSRRVALFCANKQTDTWESDGLPILPVVCMSPHGQYAAVLCTNPDENTEGFVWVLPIRDQAFQKAEAQRLELARHDVLRVYWDQQEDTSLYVAYVDEENRGCVVHYHNTPFDVAFREQQLLHPPEPADLDGFGYALVAHDRNLLIASTAHIWHGVRKGRTDPWRHWMTLQVPQVANILWGSEIALSEDGCFLAIASPYDNVGRVERAGRIYMIERESATSDWDPRVRTLTHPFEPHEDGLFGFRMVLRGSHLVVVELGGSGEAAFVFQYDWRTRQLVQMLSTEDAHVDEDARMGMGVGLVVHKKANDEASRPTLLISQNFAEDAHRHGNVQVLTG